MLQLALIGGGLLAVLVGLVCIWLARSVSLPTLNTGEIEAEYRRGRTEGGTSPVPAETVPDWTDQDNIDRFATDGAPTGGRWGKLVGILFLLAGTIVGSYGTLSWWTGLDPATMYSKIGEARDVKVAKDEAKAANEAKDAAMTAKADLEGKLADANKALDEARKAKSSSDGSDKPKNDGPKDEPKVKDAPKDKAADKKSEPVVFKKEDAAKYVEAYDDGSVKVLQLPRGYVLLVQDVDNKNGRWSELRRDGRYSKAVVWGEDAPAPKEYVQFRFSRTGNPDDRHAEDSEMMEVKVTPKAMAPR